MNARITWMLPWVLLAACGGKADEDTGAVAPGDGGGEVDDTAGPVDADGDGYAGDEDCDDSDASVHPGAEDACGDGVDQDCDGEDPACDPVDYDLGSDALAVRGSAAGEVLTVGMASGADLDGDGAADLLVTSKPRDDRQVWALLDLADGPRTGTVDVAAVAKAQVALPEGESWWKAWVGAPGDVTGDGYADVPTVGCGEDGHSACVVSGPLVGDLGWEDLDVFTVAYGDARGSGYVTLATTGDFDGDEVADLLLVDVDAVPGKAWVLYGPVTADAELADGFEITADAGDDITYGTSGASVGDVDGDGEDEAAVVSVYWSAKGIGYAGAVFVFLDPVTEDRQAEDADFVVYGTHTDEALGGARAVGDLDGDGLDDLAIPAPESDASGIDRAGAVYVFTSEPSGWVSAAEADGVLLGTEDGETAGTSVDRAGDLDGDGFGDLLVGAEQMRYKNKKPGRAWLALGPFSGRRSLADSAAVFEGVTGVGKETGSAVAGDIDLDGDGALDVVVGSWLASTDDLTACGTAYVVFGPLL